MLQGMYTAANGMMTVEHRQSVHANNIANANTGGFKRQLAVQRGYYLPYAQEGKSVRAFDRHPAPGAGVKMSETFTDFGTGTMNKTGRALDVALSGPGFLQVERNGEVFLTRAGHLNLDSEATLVDANGYPVLGRGGNTISVPPGVIRIDAAGRIFSDKSEIGQLAVVEPADPHALERVGDNLLAAAGAEDLPEAEFTEVLSGNVETSNVQIPMEMIQMTMALRAYSANQQVISSVSETVGRLIDQIGAPS